MFWKLAMLTSRIDSLLDKENVTLREILDEEDVLQECKAQNRKLVNLLVREENLSELVRLALTLPAGDVTDPLRFKYTNVACELLTSDVVTILDALLATPSLMDRIYGFLEQPPIDRPALPSGSANSQSPAAPPKPARTSPQMSANGDTSSSPSTTPDTSTSASSTAETAGAEENSSRVEDEPPSGSTPADAQVASSDHNDAPTSSPVASTEAPVSPSKPQVIDELDVDTTINPLMASFYSKIINQLLQRKTQQMLSFLRSRPNFVDLLMRNISTPAVVDVLVKLFSLIDSSSPDTRNALIDWLLEVRLYERVLGALDVRESEWVHANAAQVACEVIRVVRENATLLLPDRGSSCFGPGANASSSLGAANSAANGTSSLAKLEQLLDHVHSYECTRVLLEHMFSSEVPSSTNTNPCVEPVAASGCNSNCNSTSPATLPLASSTGDASASTSDASANANETSNEANARGSEQQADADASANASTSTSTERRGDGSTEAAAAAADAQETTASVVRMKKAAAAASVSDEVLLGRRQSVFVNGFQVLFTLLDLRKPLLDPTGGLGEMSLGRGEGFGLGAFSSDLPSSSGGLPNGNGNQPLIALDAAKVQALLHNVERALRPFFGRLCGVFDMQLSLMSGSVATASGSLENPCGACRLQLAKFLMMFFQAADSATLLELIQAGLVQRLVDSIFEYPWNNFLHASVEQAIYTLLTPESSIYSAQNLNRAANAASSRKQLITDLEADAEFEFDVRSGARGGGGGGPLVTNRESGRGSGRDELEHFLGGSPTDPKASATPASDSDSAHTDGNAQSTASAEQAALANDLAHSNTDAAAPVQNAADAHLRIVSHVLCQLQFLNKCMEAYNSNLDREQTASFRMANMGHIIRMSTYIADCMRAATSSSKAGAGEEAGGNKPQMLLEDPASAERLRGTGEVIVAALNAWSGWSAPSKSSSSTEPTGEVFAGDQTKPPAETEAAADADQQQPQQQQTLRERWTAFIEGPIEEMRNKNKIAPRSSSMRDPEDDDRSRGFGSLSSHAATKPEFTLPDDLSSPDLQQSFADYVTASIAESFPDQCSSVSEDLPRKYPYESTAGNHLAEKLASLELVTDLNDDTGQGQLFDQICNEQLKQMEDGEEDQRQAGSASPVDDLSAADDSTLSLNDAEDQPSSPGDKLQLEDLEEALPDITVPQPTRTSARSAFLTSPSSTGGGGSALDTDLLPMSLPGARSNKGASIHLVLRHPLTNLRGSASAGASSGYEAGKAPASEASDEHTDSGGTIYFARPATARSASDKPSLSGNNPFRKEAMQQQMAWVQEHDSDSQVVLRPKPSKTDNFSFAKSANNKQPAQSAISVQVRNKQLRDANVAAAAADAPKEAPATGGAGSSDEEDADLASERVFTSPPNNSRSQPLATFTSLKLIQPRQGFGWSEKDVLDDEAPEPDETDSSPNAPRSKEWEKWPGDEDNTAGITRMTTFTNAPPPHTGTGTNSQTELLGRVHVRSEEDGGDWVPFGDTESSGHVANSSSEKSSGQTNNSKGLDKEPHENASNEEWADFTDFTSATSPPPDGNHKDVDQLAPQKPIINDRRQKYIVNSLPEDAANADAQSANMVPKLDLVGMSEEEGSSA